MARPSRYSSELARKIVDFISSGLTLKDACKGCNISEDTLSRWRKKHPDFDRRIAECSDLQWNNAKSLAKYGYRPYRRIQRPLRAKYHNDIMPHVIAGIKKEPTFAGLPIRERAPIRIKETPPYFNKTTGQIERIDSNGIFRACSLAAFRRKQERRREDLPFLIY